MQPSGAWEAARMRLEGGDGAAAGTWHCGGCASRSRGAGGARRVEGTCACFALVYCMDNLAKCAFVYSAAVWALSRLVGLAPVPNYPKGMHAHSPMSRASACPAVWSLSENLVIATLLSFSGPPSAGHVCCRKRSCSYQVEAYMCQHGWLW